MEKQTEDISYSFVCAAALLSNKVISTADSLCMNLGLSSEFTLPWIWFFFLWLRSLKLKRNVCVKADCFLSTAQSNQCFFCNCQFLLCVRVWCRFNNDLKAKWVFYVGSWSLCLFVLSTFVQTALLESWFTSGSSWQVQIWKMHNLASSSLSAWPCCWLSSYALVPDTHSIKAFLSQATKHSNK